MTTSSATWFYTTPAPRPFFIAERVRTALWDQRLGSLWLETVQAEPPIRMTGVLNDAPLTLEWEPGKWLRASSPIDSVQLPASLKNVLLRRPYLRYATKTGEHVWEWWVDDEAGAARWREIQGKPQFSQPQLLKKQDAG